MIPGALSVALIAAAVSAQWRTHWAYDGPEGPEHWSELDPEYAACNAGKEQSPIDIESAEKADLPPLRFEYKAAPLQHLIDNGYTLRVNYHDAPGAGDFLDVGGTRYQLTQFHFHRPSEETVHGKPYAMVAHFMHQSSDGKVAGVAVLLTAGRANPAVQQLWDHWPKMQGKEIDASGVEVDPAALLPAEKGYYRYEGSVTAPPCTEGVTWYVLKTPVEISEEQVEAFGKVYPHDVRPLQPLNGRVVKESR
jgi:carbonic anhydrase